MGQSMPWFKVYTESRVDRKLAHLTLAERGVWINLLCFASEQEQETRGTFDASDRDTLAMECADGDEIILSNTIEKLKRAKHLIAVDGKEGWLAFRTYETRQARRPSDQPEATRERKRRERERKSQLDVNASRDVTRDIVTKRNVTSLEVEEEERREKREENTLSGKVSNNPVVVAERVNAPTAAAASASHEWTDAEARRIAKLVAYQLHVSTPNLNMLTVILKQHACAQPWLEAEAAKCYEYYTTVKPRKIDMRLFDNWLKRDEQRQREEEGKILSNGHQQQQHTTTTTAAVNGTNGTNGHSTTATETEWQRLYAQRVEQQKQQRAAGS